ncbi:SH3 domain-containing protein [Leptospira jelokensis]|uniref:SH3 domain-containing protein n=1 Tax=Leptospira jelokensis TaxID=2484931 RepID=UPI00109116A8|nr:SH3 domain-containing protein [Leptospira jelokensis]TGL99779.1 SH3 domain-containing protein [Leptospira jelokensis]
MYIKYVFICILLLFFSNLFSQESIAREEDLVNHWRKELSRFNYSLPEEFELTFKKFNYKRGGALIPNARKNVKLIEDFKNEGINYQINFENTANPLSGSDVKLAAYFNNEKLVLITSTSLYLDKYRRYEYSNILVKSGQAYEYDMDGNLTLSCFDNTQRETYSEIISREYCGESITVGFQNEILNVKKHRLKCQHECTPFYPFREKGIYFVTRNNANLRRESHSKGIVLKFLSKDSKVELLEDTFQQEWIKGLGTANYVKVRLDDGGEGYLHGAYLRAPGEPDVTLIRERAEEWKKRNGVKGY